MANFDDLKKKAAEAAETIADKSVEFAKVIAGKTKVLARKTKLMAEIAAEKDTLKKGYQELGRLYYENYSADPAESLIQAVETINLSVEKIAAKNLELEDLKNKADDDEIEVEGEECCCEECADEECSEEECSECGEEKAENCEDKPE